MTDDLAGLYGPASEAWRLNREATLLLGGAWRPLVPPAWRSMPQALAADARTRALRPLTLPA